MTPARAAQAAALVYALIVPLTAPAQQPAAAATGPVSMWLTTPDQANLLTPQPVSAVGPGDPALPTIVVDPTRTFQPIEGFGASLTESAAHVISTSPNRDAVMRALFDRGTGAGLTYLRQPIGASDFAVGSHYTYDDMPPGQTDLGLSRFSIDRDRAEILPLLRQAKQLNPDLKVMAAPWSPPAWMKTGDSLVGGQLKDDDQVYRAYAQYFVRFLKDYAAAGVTVDAISVQNEPQNRHPRQYPGTDLRPQQEARLIGILGPALTAAGLQTRIIAFDHNWALHPDDQDPADPPDPNYARTVLADQRARPYIAGIAYHCYFGDPSAQSALHQDFPDVPIYFTECSGVRSAQPANTFRDTLRWQTRNLVIGAVRNWARTAITWNLALDAAGGPHLGGCDTCTGVVTVDGGQVTRNAEYHVLGHASKFLQPGAVRVDSAVPGSLGNVAFRNPDGTVVLVVLNDTDSGQTRFTVRTGGSSFSATLPAGAVATFVQPPGGGTGGRAGAITGVGGKCVDVAGANTGNGTPIQLWTCTGTGAQSWTVGDAGTLTALGKCADITFGATGNGAKVQLYDCNGTGAQVWQPQPNGTLRNPQSEKCLDATDRSSADGTRLQIWDCHGDPNQVWHLPA
jgi:glucosylceramidase